MTNRATFLATFVVASMVSAAAIAQPAAQTQKPFTPTVGQAGKDVVWVPTAQALVDFAAKIGICRANFPNFLDEGGSGWRKASHAWSDEALQQFEAQLYSE